ncbi:MAG: shikimate dehydrogenase [Candidatus Omnitrophota bacterium]|nr:shikimate dehydrogenase [Candidatus Omnitrophota bacterium]
MMSPQGEFQLYGIFGHPLEHTLSPAMQEAAMAGLGIKAFYLIFDLDGANFRRAMQSVEKSGLRGFNVTVPYKVDVMRYVDEITREARAVGAVNTVYRRGGKWHGANTDVEGFMTALRREAKFNPRGKKVLVLGAGGAARAVLYGLATNGASEITLLNRTLRRGVDCVGRLKSHFPTTRYRVGRLERRRLAEELSDVALVVNATSLGLKPRDRALITESLIPRATRTKRMTFCDLIYSPLETPFLKAAKRRGHRTLNGVGMLAYQGARALQYWTGRRPPVELMRRTVAARVESLSKDIRGKV